MHAHPKRLATHAGAPHSAPHADDNNRPTPTPATQHHTLTTTTTSANAARRPASAAHAPRAVTMLTTYTTPGQGAIRGAYLKHDDFAANVNTLTEAETAALGLAEHVVDIIAFGPVPVYDVGKTVVTTKDSYLVQVWVPPADADDEPELGATQFWVPEDQVRLHPAALPRIDQHKPVVEAGKQPASAAGQVALAKPRSEVILEAQFVAVHSNVDAFQRAFTTAMADNQYPVMGSSEAADKLCAVQLRANISPEIRKALIADGGRDMSCAQAFECLATEYPSIQSGAALRRRLAEQRCTNRENVAAFVADMVAQYLSSYNVETVTELATKYGHHAGPVFQEIGLALAGSIAPDAQSSFALVEDELVNGCTSGNGLRDMRRAITKEHVARARHAGSGSRSAPTRTDVLTVDTAVTRLITELTSKVTALEATMAKSAPGRSSRTGERKWHARLGKCKCCAEAPASLDGGEPGGHFHSTCPSKAASHAADGESE